ncbi:unnamed protein product [Phytophthora lilii]|uniref:Unnamed protein product n=1 Tax=Phytophthora lilii TaxID=2077276 RepID=A0A9W6WFJ2_9STRA|nr:unnamed protein product [Phytophthora lilii]
MTFPNRAGYVPGQQRRDPKCVAACSSPMAAKSTVVAQKKPPRRSLRGKATAVKTEDMKQELQIMLTSLSPAHGETAASQSMIPKEESKTYVEHSRKRLFEDETFRGNESYQRLLTLTNNRAIQVQPGIADPFTVTIEQMPTISQTYQGFNAVNDGVSSSDSSRSRYIEAVSLQSMADAAEVVEDHTIKARYEESAHNLHEWGEQRMLQQQPRPNVGRGGNLLPPISMSLAQVSPYAMELAARNSLPKKRSSLSKLSKQLMHDWFEHNLHHPYPTEEEKEWLAQQGGITLEQVNNWFINTRGRKWKPMLNKLMKEKQQGNCKLYDQMVQKIEEPYHKL